MQQMKWIMTQDGRWIAVPVLLIRQAGKWQETYLTSNTLDRDQTVLGETKKGG